jgi:hypothetical protein
VVNDHGVPGELRLPSVSRQDLPGLIATDSSVGREGVLQTFIAGVTGDIRADKSMDRVLQSYELHLICCLYEPQEMCGSVSRDVGWNAGYRHIQVLLVGPDCLCRLVPEI